MQELKLHLYDKILVAQAIYESWANKHRKPCLCYFMADKVQLNAKNIQTARLVAKPDDQNIGPSKIVRVFPKTPLVIQLDLPESLEIHPVFHISLLQHEATDPLPRQYQDPREPMVAQDGAKELYVNSILSSKYDRQFKTPLLRYLVDWEGDHPSWEPILPSYKLPKSC